MFPFFVLSDILISYRFFDYIPKIIKNIFSYLFGINENIVSLLFLSIISGFPSSAKNIRMLYDNKLITGKEASHFLIFSHFANPLFIMGVVSVFFLQSEKLGIIVLISHYLPNIILGIFFKNKNKYSDTNVYLKNNEVMLSFPKIFFKGIRNSIDTLLMILGTLTCFLVISSLIIKVFEIDPYSEALIKGIMEMTMGLKSISILDVPDIYKTVISSMILSFGGLSVHMQVLSFIEGTDISYKIFFIARIYHLILSGIISFILYFILF